MTANGNIIPLWSSIKWDYIFYLRSVGKGDLALSETKLAGQRGPPRDMTTVEH